MGLEMDMISKEKCNCSPTELRLIVPSHKNLRNFYVRSWDVYQSTQKAVSKRGLEIASRRITVSRNKEVVAFAFEIPYAIALKPKATILWLAFTNNSNKYHGQSRWYGGIEQPHVRLVNQQGTPVVLYCDKLKHYKSKGTWDGDYEAELALDIWLSNVQKFDLWMDRFRKLPLTQERVRILLWKARDKQIISDSRFFKAYDFWSSSSQKDGSWELLRAFGFGQRREVGVFQLFQMNCFRKLIEEFGG
jgi:hypothetical protein